MTVFGPDISSYQHGLDISRSGDASFVIAKASEGTYYTDADYPGWRQQAASLGKLFCWYHFLTTEDAHAQAAHTAASVGNAALPGMVDVEPEGSSAPSLAQVVAYVDAAAAIGLNLRLVYLPGWYWQQLGSPGLGVLVDRGLSLVSSAFPGGSGTAAQIYPGDSAAGWEPYGGMTPLLYQFTNQAADGGQNLDFNAFRGTVSQLAEILTAPHVPPGGSVPVIPPSIAQKWPELTADFPPNTSYTDDSAIIWADAGARAAALFSQQALAAINALAARTAVVPAAVDVNALSAAIAPHLTAGATADQIATAVVAHLSAQQAGVSPASAAPAASGAPASNG